MTTFYVHSPRRSLSCQSPRDLRAKNRAGNYLGCRAVLKGLDAHAAISFAALKPSSAPIQLFGRYKIAALRRPLST